MGHCPNSIIGEVKNVSYLRYTRRIQDFVYYAMTEGYTFQLWVRPTTRLSGHIKALVDMGVEKWTR